MLLPILLIAALAFALALCFREHTLRRAAQAAAWARDAELRERMAHLERMASVGTLAAGVAHEVNNPLWFAKANLDHVARDLAERGVNGGTRNALDDVREGLDRIATAVGALRSLSGRSPLERVRVDVVSEVEAALQLAARELQHRAKVVLAVDPAPLVRARRHELGQVFLNLLVNAAQALPPGAPDANVVEVKVGADARGWAVVEVRDTGVGMAPEVRARVFEPFFTTKPPGVGTGLGLAVSRGIVEDAGGAIEVESAPGKGSVFRVLLPAASPRPEEGETSVRRFAARWKDDGS
jgi:signal transduction histidine kinase